MALIREKSDNVEVRELGFVDRDLAIRLDQLRNSAKKWRRAAHILTFLYQFMSTVLSAFVLGALAYSLDIYFQTRDRLLANGQPPWPTPTVLWPTYLLLGVSALTFVTNGLLMCVPCMHRSKKSNDSYAVPHNSAAAKAARKRTGKLLSTTQYFATAAYFVAWAVSTGLFQMANTGKDLWGWSCSPASDAIQPQVQSYLDFGRLCLIQGAGWDAMCLHAAVWALAALTYTLALFRWRQRRELRSLEEQVERQGA